jgi:hypothetical protein
LKGETHDHHYLKTVTYKYAILHSRPSNGICHQIHLERFTHPGGWTLIDGDSHIPTCGAVEMLAIGAGGQDEAVPHSPDNVNGLRSLVRTGRKLRKNPATGTSGQRPPQARRSLLLLIDC